MQGVAKMVCPRYGYGSKTGPQQCSGSISDLVLGKLKPTFSVGKILATSKDVQRPSQNGRPCFFRRRLFFDFGDGPLWP